MAEKILYKLTFLECSRGPDVYAQRLEDTSIGSYRFKVKNFSIYFDVSEANKILVLKVEERAARPSMYMHRKAR